MDLFVYGTLRAAALMQAVAGGRLAQPVAAVLPGYRICPLAGNVVPFIQAAEAASAPGVIWRRLSAAQMARLDLYEGGFGYQRAEITVEGPDGHATVQCYLPPAGLVADAGDWSLAAWEKDHLAPALLAADELFSHDPLPTPGQLRRMWPMIESRAWAKHRATVAPATARYDAGPDDVALLRKDPPKGQFFRLQGIEISHRRFDGRMTEALTRDVFLGVDAALLLPFDPKREKLLLVEQIRTGPLMRHDPNPWMLEPVAGIVDARETPDAAAFREAAEEAALTLDHLIPAAEFYVSPGASTDYFYTYVGLCDLPMDAPYFGGLGAENEDLRLHPMSLNAALALADSGEIQNGPLYFLLYWLLRHKDRLKAL